MALQRCFLQCLYLWCCMCYYLYCCLYHCAVPACGRRVNNTTCQLLCPLADGARLPVEEVRSWGVPEPRGPAPPPPQCGAFPQYPGRGRPLFLLWHWCRSSVMHDVVSFHSILFWSFQRSWNSFYNLPFMFFVVFFMFHVYSTVL